MTEPPDTPPPPDPAEERTDVIDHAADVIDPDEFPPADEGDV